MSKKYIIRGEASGVFYGEIAERNGREVTIKNARRLWYWDGAASISQIALEGVTNPDDCKFTVVVDEIVILDAIELIPCAEKAQKCIDEVEAWKR